METSFPERYASLSDEELLHIAGDRRDLLPEAADALVNPGQQASLAAVVTRGGQGIDGRGHGLDQS